MIDRNVPNLYGLSEFTHGEMFFLNKQNIRLDIDYSDSTTRDYVPRKLPPWLKMLYYKAKVDSVFAELGYYSEAEKFEKSEGFKAIHAYVLKEVAAIRVARSLARKRRGYK